jgi:hypothetical protein
VTFHQNKARSMQQATEKTENVNRGME